MDEALFNAAILSNNAGEEPYKHNCQDLIADVNDNYFQQPQHLPPDLSRS